MMTKQDYGPVFPHPTGGFNAGNGGMSLRDWFAGQAMANQYTHDGGQPDKVARWAYQVADAMLAARDAT